MTTQIQIRRDTAANWNNVDPVLAEGEIGMDMTVNAFKVGDGVSVWSAIDYAGTDISLDDYYTKVEADDTFQPKGDYLTEFVEEDPTVPDHVKEITQEDIDGWNAGGGSGGTGSSVHIGENPPADPEEGQQWMEVPLDGDATMWIYDGGKWLQQPGGKDGAAGADGADGNIADGATDGTQDGIVATWDSTANSGAGQWTPDSSLTIDPTGKATFSGTVSASSFETPEVNGNTFSLSNNKFTEADTGTELAYYGMTIDTSVDYWTRFSGYSGVAFYTNGLKRMSIDDAGNATFSGIVNVGNTKITTQQIVLENATMTLRGRKVYSDWFGISMGSTMALNPTDATGTVNDGEINIGQSSYRFKDAYFSGTVSDGSGPLMSKRGLIKTLSTLRNATKDETTLEGLRDSIGNAIGGLIEEFENQIAEMPAGDEA